VTNNNKNNDLTNFEAAYAAFCFHGPGFIVGAAKHGVSTAKHI
jgi:hypothetical protein